MVLPKSPCSCNRLKEVRILSARLSSMTRRLGILIIALVMTTAALAQRGQFRQNTPTALPPFPEAEFHFGRLAYNSGGRCAGSRGYCNPMWSIDYPHAEAHFLPALERFTRIDAADDSAHIQLLDEELFDYPWLFIQQLAAGG